MTTLLHRLSAFEPREADVISLYLDLRADQHGRDTHELFLGRAFAGHRKAEARGAAEGGPGLARALERIEAYVATAMERSADGAAIFTTTGDDDLFEAVAFGGLDGHQLFIGSVPHLYPLVRGIDQHPRYAALLVDSNRARLMVFGLGAAAARAEVTNEKTRRHSMGGWSQARYQRRTENIHLHHLKEVVETLDRVVSEEAIERVIVAGDADIVARLREELPQHLAAKVVDELRLDRHAGENEIIGDALTALRAQDAAGDAEQVAAVSGAWRGAGLGVAGPEATLRALQLGQVDELLISASPAGLKPVQTLPEDASPPPSTAATSSADGAQLDQVHLADELVTRATQSGASVRIIEDPELLREHGGVAAALRFRI